MKTIQLLTGEIATVDDRDYKRLSAYRWYRKVSSSGAIYAMTNVRVRKGKWTHVYMHQFVMGRPADCEIDHKNGDTLLNTRSNLRLLPIGKNRTGFQRKKKGTTSRFRGVFWEAQAGRWRARIEKKSQEGTRRIWNIGSFDDEVEAARAYNAAATELGFLPEALNALSDCVPD